MADAAAAPPPPRKLRVLCLHGYTQSAEAFRSRMGSWRKGLKSSVEFCYVDAPYLVEAPPLDSAAAGAPPPGAAAAAAPADAEAAEGDGAAADGGRSWWRWRDVEPGTRPSRAAEYTGWAASQAAIDAALAELAPIDGLVGFSQGATAVAMYLAHARAAPGAAPPAPLRFAVVVAGFLPRDKACAELIRATQGGAAMPTLHVGGAADTLVPPERQAALRAAFPGAAAWEHPGAHMMPTCTGALKAALLEFMVAASAAR